MNWCLKALLPLLLIPSAAAATTFSDRASFNAAVSGVVTDDLNSRPNGPITTVFGVETISSGSFAGGGAITTYGDPAFGQVLGGAKAGGSNNFDSVILTFHAPIYAFGFDDVDLLGYSYEYANVIVTRADNSVSQFSFTDPDFDFSTAAFFGFASGTALKSVEIWSSDNPGDAPGIRPNVIDNLSISRQPLSGGVPEPASWALMITGFGMAGSAMRRARRPKLSPSAG